ncbi:cytochrome d ubiquinol oxidase subunit II, partial [Gordonia sp. p3-SID1431]
MSLEEIWFLVIAFLFVGYFVLEGFDFGVGMLMPILGSSHTGGDDKV